VQSIDLPTGSHTLVARWTGPAARQSDRRLEEHLLPGGTVFQMRVI
jgi:hypothetical protein